MLDRLFGSQRFLAVYVTRPNARGFITEHRVGRVWLSLATLAVQANVLGWSVYGLYALGDKVI